MENSPTENKDSVIESNPSSKLRRWMMSAVLASTLGAVTLLEAEATEGDGSHEVATQAAEVTPAQARQIVLDREEKLRAIERTEGPRIGQMLKDYAATHGGEEVMWAEIHANNDIYPDALGSEGEKLHAQIEAEKQAVLTDPAFHLSGEEQSHGIEKIVGNILGGMEEDMHNLDLVSPGSGTWENYLGSNASEARQGQFWRTVWLTGKNYFSRSSGAKEEMFKVLSEEIAKKTGLNVNDFKPVDWEL